MHVHGYAREFFKCGSFMLFELCSIRIHSSRKSWGQCNCACWCQWPMVTVASYIIIITQMCMHVWHLAQVFRVCRATSTNYKPTLAVSLDRKCMLL